MSVLDKMFAVHPMTLPKCMSCKHYIDDAEKIACEAFPDGIPDTAIWAPDEDECATGYKYK